jgi:acetoin utilization protein AcuB
MPGGEWTMDFQNLDHMPHIKAVMTPFPYSVDLGESVDVADRMMREHDVRHLPVSDEGKLVGEISQRDIGVGLKPGIRLGEMSQVRVADLCVSDAYVVELNAQLDEVLREMAGRKIGSALVVKGDKLVGIFTMSDACRVLADLLSARFSGPGDDEVA